jgi:hypothetical protein
MDYWFSTRNRGQQVAGQSAVTEGLADVGEEVHIAGTKHKTAAELERVLAELVLAMAGGCGAPARDLVVFPQEMQQVGFAQFGRFVRVTLLVNQERELNAGFFAEELCVVHVAKADGGESRSFRAECLLVFAQLRDVLAAEDSAPVAKKNKHRWAVRP